jgi:hypothetical protein
MGLGCEWSGETAASERRPAMALEHGTPADQAKQWGQIVARAWEDEAFKARLLADPRAVVQEYGIAVPAGKAVQVAAYGDDTVLLVLPPKPGADLVEEELAQVVGGCSCTTIYNDPPPKPHGLLLVV